MKQAPLLTFSRAQSDEQMARVTSPAEIRRNLSDYRIVSSLIVAVGLPDEGRPTRTPLIGG